MQDFGRILIVVGIITFIVGILLYFSSRVPFIGKLPGDIFIKKENFTFYFPLATSILVSVVLSLIFYFFNRR